MLAGKTRRRWLREIEAPILLAPIEETLAAFREALEAKFKLVNERIARGEYKYINAKVIGTHEHESHYVYDLLHNNTTDIKPERHSTDTHGTNQVNFWILHVFGYRFAPRYRDLYKRMDTLVGFMHPNHYKDFLIKPVRKVFDSLICKEWPNVQRIVASLAQKDVTQATIVRKLASYRRQNQTKKALWELDNICRTLYILDFIDDEALRQRVQKALNRGEAYHRFRRAIA
jgi:TnpA family transposase